jgi:hypothetical protein
MLAIGEAQVSISGAISAGTAIRTRSPDPALISAVNGAAAGLPATSPAGRNQEDGNLNYRTRGRCFHRA